MCGASFPAVPLRSFSLPASPSPTMQINIIMTCISKIMSAVVTESGATRHAWHRSSHVRYPQSGSEQFTCGANRASKVASSWHFS